MEPDRSQDTNSSTPRRSFEERFLAPLAYLRGLVGSDDASDANLVEALTGGVAGPVPDASQARESDDSESGATDGDSKGAAAAPSGGARDRAQSLLKRLEDAAGFVPILDLPSPGQTTPTPEVEPPKLAEKRYLVEGELALGGMGKVLNVYDQDIRRHVAMKVLRTDCREARQLSKFLEEAQATGQLEHPNIAPVYDLGIDPENGIFFTMKLVRGRNLGEVLRDLAIGRPETRKRFTLTRLVQILQQVAMGVHYAHARGVIHRDLKPDNIMVGDFGESLVMDWGLAKIVGQHLKTSGPEDPVLSHRQKLGDQTLYGTVSGTPAYMSPEQARGWVDDIDERTDIFGLGAILYEALTHHPPYEGDSSRTLLAKAGAGEIERPGMRAPRNRIPGSLEDICMKALASAKEDRYADAMAFHEDLQIFLDGTLESQRREKEASTLARQGRDKASAYRRLLETEEELLGQAQETLAVRHPHDSHVLKVPGWELEDRAAHTRHERIQAFNEATALLHSAINVDATHVAAKEALADLYWTRFEEAEKIGNKDDMAIYRGLAELYQQGKLTALLEGKGLVSVDSDPAGAQVFVERMVERSRQLVPEATSSQPAGVTPLEFELPVGSYRLKLQREGFPATYYPVLVERCARHVARVNLYRQEEIGDGFLFLPASECALGGDAAAPGSLSAGRRYIPDLFVGEFPVTFRQYCRFLDDLRDAADPEIARWFPQTEKEGECVRTGTAGFEPARDYLDIDPATGERHASDFEWELPVFGVSWHAATRYASWLAEKSRRRVRLIRDHEWEKAAGGGHSRYPWGDRFDWSFVKGGLSRPERAQPEPVGTFELDRSVYGVRDLAGSIREWCQDWFFEKKYRVTRGGGWYSSLEGAFRTAYRQGSNPAICSSLIGFRVAVEPPPRRVRGEAGPR